MKTHIGYRIFVFSLVAVALLISFGFSKKPGKPKLKFNSVVYNQQFVNNLSHLDIQVLAPAGGAVQERIAKLRELHYLNVPENIIDATIPYHSKTDVTRFRFLQELLVDHRKNTILWALRGGYGSARLIDELMKMSKPPQQILLIGYSDITVLHLFLSQQWKWQSIHGAMLNELLDTGKDPKNFEKISDLLSGKTTIAKLEALKPLNKLAKTSSKITGLLTGGNLTVVGTSLGTPWQIQADNKIVFLEDVDEDGYRVDRVLNHLKQAGVFKNVKAIVLGEFLASKTGTIEEINFALQRFADEVNIPVYKTNEFGHGTINYPLIYNAQSEILKTGENAELIMPFD